jgi:hypothetical protein
MCAPPTVHLAARARRVLPRIAGLAALGATLAGCASTGAVLLPGERDPNPPVPDTAARETQHYPPKVVERPAPSYPAEALGHRVICKALVTIEVDREGRPLLLEIEWLLSPPTPLVYLFETSLEETVPRWIYLPAVHLERSRKPDGEHEYEGGYAGSRDQVLVTFRPVTPMGEALVHPLGEP